MFKDINGGDEENRTPDPLLARQVLSQLSYAPVLEVFPQNQTMQNQMARLEIFSEVKQQAV